MLTQRLAGTVVVRETCNEVQVCDETALLDLREVVHQQIGAYLVQQLAQQLEMLPCGKRRFRTWKFTLVREEATNQ